MLRGINVIEQAVSQSGASAPSVAQAISNPRRPLPSQVEKECLPQDALSIHKELTGIGISVSTYGSTLGVVEELRRLRNLPDSKIPQAQYEKLLRSMIPYMHRETVSNEVISVLAELKATEAIRAYSHYLYKDGDYFAAFGGFKALGFTPGMFSSARRYDRVNHTCWSSPFDALPYLETKLHGADIDGSFKEWVGPRYKKMDLSVAQSAGPLLVAHTLAPHYDICVAIAKQGLHGGYFLAKFGMPVVVAESHVRNRHGNSYTTFKWGEKPSATAFEGKRVLVIDNDIVTGQTVARVAEEIKKFRPASLALALTDSFQSNPHTERHIHNVPEGFEAIHTTNDMNGMLLGAACAQLLYNLKRSPAKNH